MIVGILRRTAILVLGLGLLAGCNSVNNTQRKLVSISITPTTANGSNGPVTFTASGTFNTDPTTVTPLAAFWTISGPGIDPTCTSNCQYQLTNAAYTAKCGPIAGTDTITAQAPADPNAPPTGSLSDTKMVSATAQLTCP